MKKQILRFVTISFRVICEYLLCEAPRIRSAAFAAIRLIISYGLKPSMLLEEKDDLSLILNFDALTISAEVENIRNDRRSKLSGTDKLLVHICYLLSSRFESQLDFVLKIVETLITKVGK